MWLDRFSVSSTPSTTPPPANRNPYPQRRPTGAHLAPGAASNRPGLSPRSSSLSLLSSPNVSTDSLPRLPLRAPNGSSLKYSVTTSPPANVQDPVEALAFIVGKPLPPGSLESSADVREVPKPEKLEADVAFGELSLEEFAREAEERTLLQTSVSAVSVVSSAEFQKEEDKFDDLHASILACDEVLTSVGTYLTSFQADLARVSAEIETLQSRSSALSTKLENRKKVEKLLGPAVEEITVPPNAVKKLSEGAMDDSWLSSLQELEKRSKVIEAKSSDAATMKALDDLRPLLDNLHNKAVERIRDYLVAQVRALRSPNINAQIIQHQAFLKFKEAFAYLARRQPQLSEDICQAYVNTMRWYYHNNFTRYLRSLEKLKIHVIDKSEAIAADETGKKAGSLISGARIPTAPHDAFSIGRRGDLLKSPSHAAISSYVAEEDQSNHYLEVPFRAFNLALVDNATAEYTFLTAFFTNQTFHAVSRTFSSIFDATFTLGQTLTKQLIENTNDALGILLCVRLNQQFAFELQRRKIPAMEGYINATNIILWPRFQQVMDAHSESIRRMSGRSAGSALLFSATPAQTTAPHPLTQRFANFVQGILALSAEAGDDEPVGNSLRRLRSDFEAFLTKLSKGISDQRKKERFLFNNYSLVGTIIGDAKGKMAEEMIGHFGKLKEVYEVTQ